VKEDGFVAEAPVAALVMAGAPNDGPLKEASDAPYEALIDIGGRPMVEYVLDALRAAPSVGAIAVVGPAELRKAVRLGDALLLESAGSVLDNLERGVRALREAGCRGHLLVATSDIPLITVEALETFLALCRRRDAEAPVDRDRFDAYYPMVSRENCDARFPGVQRTYVGLKDGQFTGGNVVLLDPAVVLDRRQLFEQVVALRKDPVGMARLLGFGFIVKFLLRRLTARDIENIVREKFGIVGAVIQVPHAEVGFDVDKPSDLAIARAALGVR